MERLFDLSRLDTDQLRQMKLHPLAKGFQKDIGPAQYQVMHDQIATSCGTRNQRAGPRCLASGKIVPPGFGCLDIGHDLGFQLFQGGGVEDILDYSGTVIAQ